MMTEIADLTEHLDRYPWQRLKAGHMRDGGPPALVASRQRNRDQSSEDCATSVVRELQKHCDAYGGYQRYQVLLIADQELLGEHICDLSGQERARSAAMTTSSTPAMVMPEDSEVARVALRLTTASFNHAETAWRMLGAGYQGMLGSMAAENMRLRQRNEALERRDQERREFAEEMTEAQHRRQLELAKHERDTKFRQQLVDRVSEVAPVVISELTGANQFGRLIDTMSVEQFQGIMAVSSPEQQALMLDLLQKSHRGDIARQIMAGQRPPPSADDGQSEAA